MGCLMSGRSTKTLPRLDGSDFLVRKVWIIIHYLLLTPTIHFKYFKNINFLLEKQTFKKLICLFIYYLDFSLQEVFCTRVLSLNIFCVLSSVLFLMNRFIFISWINKFIIYLFYINLIIFFNLFEIAHRTYNWLPPFHIKFHI